MNNDARGFTLLEVLVAFAVLAVSLGVAFETFSIGMRSSRTAEALATAALHAESRLETVGTETPLAEGETAGELTDGYRWHVAVRPFETERDADETPALPLAFAVTVTVSWQAGDGPRAVSLTSLRLAPR